MNTNCIVDNKCSPKRILLILLLLVETEEIKWLLRVTRNIFQSLSFSQNTLGTYFIESIMKTKIEACSALMDLLH